MGVKLIGGHEGGEAPYPGGEDVKVEPKAEEHTTVSISPPVICIDVSDTTIVLEGVSPTESAPNNDGADGGGGGGEEVEQVLRGENNRENKCKDVANEDHAIEHADECISCGDGGRLVRISPLASYLYHMSPPHACMLHVASYILVARLLIDNSQTLHSLKLACPPHVGVLRGLPGRASHQLRRTGFCAGRALAV